MLKLRTQIAVTQHNLFVWVANVYVIAPKRQLVATMIRDSEEAARSDAEQYVKGIE